jgi:hypothetical protein
VWGVVGSLEALPGDEADQVGVSGVGVAETDGEAGKVGHVERGGLSDPGD